MLAHSTMPVVLVAACLAVGCDSATDEGPSPLAELVVTVSTGQNGTDQDVELCYAHGDVSDVCEDLSSAGVDDFEPGSDTEARIDVPEDTSLDDLHSMYLRLTSSTFNVDSEPGWEPTAVEVRARTFDDLADEAPGSVVCTATFDGVVMMIEETLDLPECG